ANLDTLAVCISYGIKKVKLSIIASLLISFITSLGTFLSMYFGYVITNFISPKIVTALGGSLLLFLGFKMIIDFTKKYKNKSNGDLARNKKITYSEILDEPEKADIDNSGDIDLKECITLSIALTLNNISLGIAASIAGISILLNTIFTFVLTLINIGLGFYIGNKYASTLMGEYSDLISGLLLISIGIYQVIL
ncbi:MAG: sporulation membrane protein YtaF, partial [Peptostreptococcaceae bacterium]